jgi:hypothetical protein
MRMVGDATVLAAHRAARLGRISISIEFPAGMRHATGV